MTGLAGFTGSDEAKNEGLSTCRWPVNRAQFSREIAGNHAAAEAHFGGEFAPLDREGAVEQGEAVDLFFVGRVSEAAGDFGGDGVV